MEGQQPIRIFVVDDHEVIRFAFESWIQKTHSENTNEIMITIVGSASTGAEALELIPQQTPTVLLIDLQLPDMLGTEVIKSLRASGWDSSKLRVLVMTGMETASVREILASGANGYLSKQESSETFIAAVRYVATNTSEVWLNPSVAKQMLNAEKALHEAGITLAEKNVLRLIRLSNEEVGELLSISKGTVKNHVANIFQKLGITDRQDAVQFAIKVGLIPKSSRL